MLRRLYYLDSLELALIPVQEFFIRLPQVTTLSALKWRMTGELDPLQLPPRIMVYATLRELEFEACDTIHGTAFFTHTQFPELERISLKHAPIPHALPNIKAAIRSLGTCHKLRDVCMCLPVPGTILPSAVFNPFLDCRQIERFRILSHSEEFPFHPGYAQIPWCDEDIAQMARNWRQLRHLELGTMSYGEQEVHITICGLIPLCQQCPNLAYLTLSINACNFRRPDFGLRPSHVLWNFRVAPDTVVDTDATVLMAAARFILDMWPNSELSRFEVPGYERTGTAAKELCDMHRTIRGAT
ncbi:hypothetical protein CALVIDRAFT_563760 [Calocera viscosa TUFC12733]|uniref:F-box domain-containing protein n=1 Tax=Calocera viscosa (strain TUFC12733) TaxID=1330018 RepID=A0A167MGI4_CALVF|nr:hypothetical protein CALVIDRAFT_563760 [Calocera viscosa TUFC12733]